jgi:hypothetical protein
MGPSKPWRAVQSHRLLGRAFTYIGWDRLGSLWVGVPGYIRKENAHKQVMLVINKGDPVLNWHTAYHLPVSLCHALRDLWTGTIYSTSHAAVSYLITAFHSFSKESLIRLMRQFFLATFGQANLCWVHRLLKCSEERRHGHPYAHER